MDLSKIRFEGLRIRFNESKHRNTDVKVIEATMRTQLEELTRSNKARTDSPDKFEELVKLGRDQSDRSL